MNLRYVVMAATGFQEGQRVAVNLEPKKPKPFFYGVIKRIDGPKIAVHMDTGEEVKVSHAKIIPVVCWEDNKKAQTLEELTETEESPLKLYTKKVSVKFGLQTLRGMYWFINDQIFNGNLMEVPLKIEALPGRWGQVIHHKEGDRWHSKLLQISNRHHVPYRIFGTMAHEMIHVFQAETADRLLTKNDWHGDDFKTLAEHMNKRLKIEVSETSDADTETEYQIKEGGFTHYVVLWQSGEHHFAFRTGQLAILAEMVRHNAYKNAEIITITDKTLASAIPVSKNMKTGTAVGASQLKALRSHGKVIKEIGGPLYFGFYWLTSEGLITASHDLAALKKAAAALKGSYLIFDMPPEKRFTAPRQVATTEALNEAMKVGRVVATNIKDIKEKLGLTD